MRLAIGNMRFRQERGRDGEAIAVAFLLSQRMRVVERNWRARGRGLTGELDIIAWDETGREPTLCFVEVKTRALTEDSNPQGAVNREKQAQISRLANAYVSARKGPEVACRFDVVEVWMPDGPELPRVALHRGAFDYQTMRKRG